MMGCSIDADPNVFEKKMDNGLIAGHAYSITDVRKVSKLESTSNMSLYSFTLQKGLFHIQGGPE